MNEEPTKSLSSNNFNLFDLNKNDLEACNFKGDSVSSTQNTQFTDSSAKDVLSDYLKSCKSHLLNQGLSILNFDKTSKNESSSPPVCESEHEELFNLNEEFNNLNDSDSEFVGALINLDNNKSRGSLMESNGLTVRLS